jgi:hypothetical protein
MTSLRIPAFAALALGLLRLRAVIARRPEDRQATIDGGRLRASR